MDKEATYRYISPMDRTTVHYRCESARTLAGFLLKYLESAHPALSQKGGSLWKPLVPPINRLGLISLLTWTRTHRSEFPIASSYSNFNNDSIKTQSTTITLNQYSSPILETSSVKFSDPTQSSILKLTRLLFFFSSLLSLRRCSPSTAQHHLLTYPFLLNCSCLFSSFFFSLYSPAFFSWLMTK
jgi:hypothetical protein